MDNRTSINDGPCFDSDEIDLRELAGVLMRRKKTIFGIVLAAVIGALVISIALPKAYEIKTALEIGVIVTPETNEAIESSVQLQEKIEKDVYGNIVRQELKISEQDYPKIKVENLKDTNAVFVSTRSSRVDEAKKIFQAINALILADHAQKLEVVKKKSETRIKIEEKNIERLQNKIQSLEREKNAVEGRVAVLQTLPITSRDAGTQFALFDNKEQFENKIQEIENTYQQINSSEAFINSLQTTINQSKMTEVIREPLASEKPVSPRPLLNAVLAAVLGLFVGIFGALIAEWWNNTKKFDERKITAQHN